MTGWDWPPEPSLPLRPRVLLRADSAAPSPPYRWYAGRDFLRSRFPEPWLTLAPGDHPVLVDSLVAREIGGGGTYDGLVALTAARHGARLLSRDRRAARVYEALGVEFELLV